MKRIRPTGFYATYRSVEYPVEAYGDLPDGTPYVGWLVEPADAQQFADTVTRADGSVLARVPESELERFESVTTTGTFDGQEVVLHGDGSIVKCMFVGDPTWAASHGFSGSPHDHWAGHVAIDEITDIRETVRELRSGVRADYVTETLPADPSTDDHGGCVPFAVP